MENKGKEDREDLTPGSDPSRKLDWSKPLLLSLENPRRSTFAKFYNPPFEGTPTFSPSYGPS